MLWFNHPKPVAMLAQPRMTSASAEDAEEAVMHESRGQALQFSVRYTLVEYVSFMWQHARHLIRRRRIPAPASWYMLVKSTWGSAFHFVMQRRSRHTYQFTIDQQGILRSGPGGVTLIKWAEVRAIRSYSRGRLLVLQRGTLPIPARCLNRAQADSLAAYAASLKASAAAHASAGNAK